MPSQHNFLLSDFIKPKPEPISPSITLNFEDDRGRSHKFEMFLNNNFSLETKRYCGKCTKWNQFDYNIYGSTVQCKDCHAYLTPEMSK